MGAPNRVPLKSPILNEVTRLPPPPMPVNTTKLSFFNVFNLIVYCTILYYSITYYKTNTVCYYITIDNGMK